MARSTEAAMTVRDVAAYLNVDEKTVYRLSQRGKLPGFKVAGHWRFKRSDLDGWIEQQKQAALTNQRNPTNRVRVEPNDESTEAEG